MPWSPTRGPQKHNRRTRGKSPRARARARKWSSVANRVLDETGDEARAVRIANAAIRRKPRRRKVWPHGR